MPPVRNRDCEPGSGKRRLPRPPLLRGTVGSAEPLRAVGTKIGALHMLTRHGLSDSGQMGHLGAYVKRAVRLAALAHGRRPILVCIGVVRQSEFRAALTADLGFSDRNLPSLHCVRCLQTTGLLTRTDACKVQYRLHKTFRQRAAWRL